MFQHQHKPARPEYADAYNRLRSFTGRTLPAGQTADALANAGFFYTGKYIAYDRLIALLNTDIFNNLFCHCQVHHICFLKLCVFSPVE